MTQEELERYVAYLCERLHPDRRDCTARISMLTWLFGRERHTDVLYSPQSR